MQTTNKQQAPTHKQQAPTNKQQALIIEYPKTLTRGTLSLSERLLRQQCPLIARQLRNTMLSDHSNELNIVFSDMQLQQIKQSLQQSESNAQPGQKILYSTLLSRWQNL